MLSCGEETAVQLSFLIEIQVYLDRFFPLRQIFSLTLYGIYMQIYREICREKLSGYPSILNTLVSLKMSSTPPEAIN